MSQLTSVQFLRTLPEVVVPELPPNLQTIQIRQPYRWLVQFHYGEPWLHYEVARAQRRNGWELGFHCEARDKRLNRFLLDGFRRNLFEIKDVLGDGIEAEMWDRGWTKIYEVAAPESLTPAYQKKIGARLAEIIVVLHPFYTNLRNAVAEIYR
jgi:hypothetical protein